MRLARINDIEIDIDEKTAIGITFQNYDLSSPGQRKVKISNTFNIPATSHNLNIFGNPNNVQSLSKKVYAKNTFDYWVDNEQLINKAKLRVESINDRINLFIFQKEDVWDLTKKVLWPEFTKNFIRWMHKEKSLPSKDNPFTGTFQEFIEQYTATTEGIKLPFYFSNLYNYDPDGGEAYLEDFNSLYLKYWPTGGDQADGGHFCVYCKTIFQYLEYTYGVDFLTDGGQKTGNIWDDEIAKKLYIPVRDIAIRFVYSGGNVTGFYFENNISSLFLPLKDQKDKADKTLYGLINSFFQHLGVIIDEFEDENIIRLARFNNIASNSFVGNWSGKFSGTPTFKPAISGYAQENIIRFKGIFEEGDELLNSVVLNCRNEGLDATGDLFAIDAYIPSFLTITGGIVPDMSPSESFKTFVFLLDSGETDDLINVYNSENGNEKQAVVKMQKSALYDLSEEYNTLQNIIEYPRFYEVEKWLTFNEIKNLEFFKLYWIRELNGAYFLNKISGFNPQKSNKATKLELIYVNDRTPFPDSDLNIWVDGVGDNWVDGVGDVFV